MKKYELLFILPGTLAETEVQPIVEKVKNILVEAGATEIKNEDMGKNRLAYPMKHIRYGYFQLCHFSAESEQTVVIQRKLTLVDELLRALIQEYDGKRQTLAKINYFNLERTGETNEPAVFSHAVPVESRVEVVVPTPALVHTEIKIEDVPKAKNREEKENKVASQPVSMEEIDKQLDKILDADIEV